MNTNSKENPKTNFIALVLFINGLLSFWLPTVKVLQMEIPLYIPIGCFLLGIVFWLSPDTALESVNNFIKKIISK